MRLVILIVVVGNLFGVVPSAFGVTSYNIPLVETITSPNQFSGQIITAPAGDNILQDFTLFALSNAASGVSFNINVAPWDNANQVLSGPPLFTSATEIAPVSSTFSSFTISPSLQLQSGSTYMVYVDGHHIFPYVALGGGAAHAYTGGALAFEYSPEAGTWYVTTDGSNLAFSADFVPEPCAAFAAFVVLGLLTRRRESHEI